MEPEGSLPHSQLPATSPYPQLRITFCTMFLQVPKDPWDIIRKRKLNHDPENVKGISYLIPHCVTQYVFMHPCQPYHIVLCQFASVCIATITQFTTED